MNNKKNISTNVPVALIFFARPDVLKITFKAIREARPTKLFLIQDGCRESRPDDKNKVDECRKIVENIDWDCEVYKNYSDQNLGCGMRVYSGVSWAFKYVDRLAIIEDDCVPSIHFFKFCEEILEKYKNDERMDMISGMNHEGISENIHSDYFFSGSGSIWGWATWKRVWDSIDYNFGFINDSDAERFTNNKYGPTLFRRSKEMLNSMKMGKKLSSWSLQRGMNMYLNSRLIIVPKFNFITNIGLTDNGANSVNSIKLIPKGLRRVYFMKAHKINFPLNHPKYVIEDVAYKKKVDRIMGNGHPLVNIYRTIEAGFYKVASGDFSGLLKSIKRRLIK